jgi:hypothetical protein
MMMMMMMMLLLLMMMMEGKDCCWASACEISWLITS